LLLVLWPAKLQLALDRRQLRHIYRTIGNLEIVHGWIDRPGLLALVSSINWMADWSSMQAEHALILILFHMFFLLVDQHCT
jgi:hypothetical protein